jgi:hypothetical protein
MKRIPLWPFAVLLMLIAVAVTLHAEGPDFERGQEIACEAELTGGPCACACESPRLSREVENLTDATMGSDLEVTVRTHVVQDRREVSSAIFDNALASHSTGESRHLSCKAVGSAGVCSASDHPHLFEADACLYHDETTVARPRYRGGAA